MRSRRRPSTRACSNSRATSSSPRATRGPRSTTGARRRRPPRLTRASGVAGGRGTSRPQDRRIERGRAGGVGHDDEAFPGIGGNRVAGLRPATRKRTSRRPRNSWISIPSCGSTRSGAPAPRAATTSCASACSRPCRASASTSRDMAATCARSSSRPAGTSGGPPSTSSSRAARPSARASSWSAARAANSSHSTPRPAPSAGRSRRAARSSRRRPLRPASSSCARWTDACGACASPTAARPGSMSSPCPGSRCAATGRRSWTATWCLPASTTARWSRSR